MIVVSPRLMHRNLKPSFGNGWQRGATVKWPIWNATHQNALTRKMFWRARRVSSRWQQFMVKLNRMLEAELEEEWTIRRIQRARTAIPAAWSLATLATTTIMLFLGSV